MKQGHVKIPNYIKDINPPTLWTYYYTLPKWARDDPVVKNVVMACEYNQPWMPIRAKEQVLNYAMSMLRPIEPLLKQVLTDAMMSQKTELNCKLGVTMMQDLPFYELDVEAMGSESEDHEDEDDGNQMAQILQMGRDAESKYLSPSEMATKEVSAETRYHDMQDASRNEMGIDDYQVEPATNKCLTDFYTKVYPDGDAIEARDTGDHNNGVAARELPINYYDNDDGFWDDYIDHKL